MLCSEWQQILPGQCERGLSQLKEEDLPGAHILATLENCYAALDDFLDAKSKEELKSMDTNDMWKYHFSLGLWIRNNLIYPKDKHASKHFHEIGITHEDNMSHIILEGYHHHLNGREYTISIDKWKTPSWDD